MAITAQVNPRLQIGTFNLTTAANMINVGAMAEMKDITTWNYLPFRNFTPGLKVIQIDIGGFNDYTTVTGWDEYARSILGVPQQVVTLAELGDTVGSIATITRGIVDNLPTFVAAVGEVPKIKVKVSGTGNVLAEGQVTQSTTSTITVTGNTTPVNVGAVSATQTIYAAIHAVTVTGTTPSATFQLASSTTSGGAYTARGSAGSALTAASSQWLSATGPFTDTWWRLNVTVSGTTPVFTVLASIAVA